jgi:hypothetical protein
VSCGVNRITRFTVKHSLIRLLPIVIGYPLKKQMQSKLCSDIFVTFFFLESKPVNVRIGWAVAFSHSVYQTRYINNWALPRLGLDSTVAGLLLKPMQSIWILCSGVIKSELTAIVYPSSRKKLASISFGLCNCQVAFTNLDAGSVLEGV